jgi:hypothetical protein
VFLPDDQAACLECAWDARDYELVEQDYPCQGVAAQPATNASPALGALAAALQAFECEKLLGRRREHSLDGRDVLIDATHHRHYVTQFRRNPACRMPDHGGWRINPSNVDPCSTTLADLVAVTASLPGSDGGVRMSVAGQQFAMARTCQQCGARLAAGYLERGDRRRNSAPCRECGGSLTVAGFDVEESILLSQLPKEAANRSISELGLLVGDVMTFSTSASERRVELCGAA